MSSAYGRFYNQINRVVPDLGFKGDNHNTNDFFGYLLISQIETVESLSQLEKKYLNLNQKNDSLEKTVDYLKEKCLSMEEVINNLKNLAIKENPKTDLNIQTSINDNENTKTSNYTSNFISINQNSNLNRTESLTSLTSFTPIYSNEIAASYQTIDDKQLFETKPMNLGEFEDVKNFQNTTGCCQCTINSSFNCIDKSLNTCLVNKDGQNNGFLTQDHKEIQRLFNKRVKYEVNRKFGPSYLAEHQVRELDVKEMYKIKKKVFRLFSPFPIPIKIAWNNAMNSLRQDRHQLKKRRHSE